MSEKPITEWIDALKEGTASDAEQGIWEEYFRQLMNLARSRMRNFRKTCESEEDVVLSAMNSFFRRVQGGQYPDLRDRTSLWPLLVQTTDWKIKNVRRRNYRQCRDVRRELSFDWLRENGPTAELAAKVVDSGNELLESLENEKLRHVAALKLEGYANAEIAEEIRRSVKTVEWRLRQIRKHLIVFIEKE